MPTKNAQMVVKKAPSTFHTKGPNIKKVASIPSINCIVTPGYNTSEGSVSFLLLYFKKCILILPSCGY